MSTTALAENNEENNNISIEIASSKNEIAKLTDKQKDYLRAVGVSDEELVSITNGEVADILKTRDIVNPLYLKKYIDTEQLYREAKLADEYITDTLKSKGLDNDEIASFKETGLNIYDFENSDISTIKKAIVSNENSNPYSLKASTVYHTFRSCSLLNTSTTIFHKDSWPLYYENDDGEEIYAGYNPDPGTDGYDLREDLLIARLNDVRSAYIDLYSQTPSNSSVYNYYLYGESRSTSGLSQVHEGVDVYGGDDISSLCDGIVIAKFADSYNGTTHLVIYNDDQNVFMIYMHLNFASSLYIGQEIDAGDIIGTQGWHGLTSSSSAHTHLEVQEYEDLNDNGEVDSGDYDIHSGLDTALESLKPYAYFWFWCEYLN